MTGDLMKRGYLDTEADMCTRKIPREDEVRDGGNVSASPGTPEVASKPQNPGKRQGTIFCYV